MLTGIAALRAVVALICLTISSAHKVSLLPSPLIGTLGDIVHALCCNEDTSSFITKLTLRRSDRNDFTKKVENLLKESLKCSYFENTGCTNCSVPAVQENNGSLLVCSVFSRITGEVVSQVSRTFHVQMSEEDKLEEASQYGISWRHKLAVAIITICLSWFAVFFVLLWQQHIKYHDELKKKSQTDHQHTVGNHHQSNTSRVNESRTNGRAHTSQANGLKHHTRQRQSPNNTNGVSQYTK